MNQQTKIAYSAAYGILAFMVAMTLSWVVMMKFDFFYGVWHDHGGIQEGIEIYGPKNRYKNGFAQTTRQQRVDLFHQINKAVHSGGDGLEEITYQSPSSNGEQKLLRKPEVVHLTDVANLIDLMIWVMAVVLFVCPAMAIYFYKKQGCLPKIKFQLVGIGGLLALLGLLLIVFGAENVFNTLHVWVFPKEHQWFFYYQESLMSTMMLAPLLFAWIGAAWVVISIVMYVLLSFLVSKGISWAR